MFVFKGKETNVIDFCMCVWYVSVSVIDAKRDNDKLWELNNLWCRTQIPFNPLICSLQWKTYHSVQSRIKEKQNSSNAISLFMTFSEMVIGLQQLLSFFNNLRYLLNRLLHWFLGRQMVVCMLQDNQRNEQLFSSVDEIQYSDVLRAHFYCT